MEFKEKVVWITGATSGIGEAVAHAFARKKAKLVLSARREEVLQEVQKACLQFTNKVLVLPLDLEKENEFTAKASTVVEKLGRIDVLLNNGGISQRASAIDTSLEVDRKIMNINYFGTIALTKAVLPYMVQQRGGQIGVISSVTGKIGVPMRSAYAASKHALFGFFDTLRAEHWKDNIQVTLFCPGYVQTNISLNALTSSGQPQNKMDKDIAKGMSPEYLANVIVKSIAKGKNEVYVGGKEVMGIYIRRFLPNLFFKIMRKYQEG